MNNFQRIAVSKQRSVVGLARNDCAISLYDDARRTYLQLLQQCGNAQSISNFSVFSVNLELHTKLKNRIHTDH
jgi:hypothetical protein